jgi:hypothetical protein
MSPSDDVDADDVAAADDDHGDDDDDDDDDGVDQEEKADPRDLARLIQRDDGATVAVTLTSSSSSFEMNLLQLIQLPWPQDSPAAICRSSRPIIQ